MNVKVDNRERHNVHNVHASKVSFERNVLKAAKEDRSDEE